MRMLKRLRGGIMYKKDEINIVTPNQMRIVIDKDSDPKNVALFKDLNLDIYNTPEEEEKKEN